MTRKFLTRLIADIESEFSQIGYFRPRTDDAPSGDVELKNDPIIALMLVGPESGVGGLRRAFWFTIRSRSLERYEIVCRVAMISDAIGDLVHRLPAPAQLVGNLQPRFAGTVDEANFHELGAPNGFGYVFSATQYPVAVASLMVRAVEEHGTAWFLERVEYDDLLALARRRERVSLTLWNIRPMRLRAVLMLGVHAGRYQPVSTTIDWYMRKPIGINDLDSKARVKEFDEFLKAEFSDYRLYRESIRIRKIWR